MSDRKFTVQELEDFDGSKGGPLYVAYKGRVIDVSESKMWRNGQHMRRHQAGADLTEALRNAPHGSDVLDRFPQVGTLATTRSQAPQGREVPGIVRRFPFLKRHPHPMTVHFPIVFSLAAAGFTFLTVVTGSPIFDAEAFHLLIAGAIFTPVAVITGLYTWWLNYMAQPIKPVRRKLVLSPLLFLIMLACIVWRHEDPAVLQDLNGAGMVYLLLVLSIAPLAGLIGWYGAIMTFPPHDE